MQRMPLESQLKSKASEKDFFVSHLVNLPLQRSLFLKAQKACAEALLFLQLILPHLRVKCALNRA